MRSMRSKRLSTPSSVFGGKNSKENTTFPSSEAARIFSITFISLSLSLSVREMGEGEEKAEKEREREEWTAGKEMRVRVRVAELESRRMDLI